MAQSIGSMLNSALQCALEVMTSPPQHVFMGVRVASMCREDCLPRLGIACSDRCVGAAGPHMVVHHVRTRQRTKRSHHTIPIFRPRKFNRDRQSFSHQILQKNISYDSLRATQNPPSYVSAQKSSLVPNPQKTHILAHTPNSRQNDQQGPFCR